MLYKLRRKLQKLLVFVFGYTVMTHVYYFLVYKAKLNLSNPKKLSEKIQWLKLYHFPKTKLIVDCTDKIKVRDYIESKGLKHILSKKINTYYRKDDLSLKELPNSFALKFNHGCGYNLIVQDKSKIDLCKTEKLFNLWWKENFSLYNAEKHYKYIKPGILVEENLGEELLDYKFFCFNGIPKFFYIAKGFATKNSEQKMSFYNLDGSKTSFKRLDYKELDDDEINFEIVNDMIDYAKVLSSDFVFVRVDFFLIGKRVVFSELTFTPGGGYMSFDPKEADNDLGELLDISKLLGRGNK